MNAASYFKSFDIHEIVIRYGQTIWGRFFGITFFAILLSSLCSWWIEATIIIAMITFFPTQRKWWLFLGMLMLILMNKNGYDNLHNVSLILLLSLLLMALKKRFHHYFISRYPVLILITLLTTGIILVSSFSLSAVEKLLLGSFLLAFSHFIWFMGYSLREYEPNTHRDLIFEYSRYLPIWGGSTTPFPKGAAYLQKIEAKTADEFIVVQVKGIKLLLWATFLAVLLEMIKSILRYYQVPLLENVFKQYAAHHYLSCPMAWFVLFSHFLISLLSLTIWGHTIIAICRMCGYNALRNTYKPLYARTVVEFWNRYYFYFKELLADMFFYPTFFLISKKYPRLRLFFATFCAAAIGNLLFHFFANLSYVMENGLLKALSAFTSYIFYACVLSIGITISQIKNQNKIFQENWLERLKSFIGVMSFYIFLSIFGEVYASPTILVNFKFLGTLFDLYW